MPVATRETSDARIIAHVDMDCFYVQVEQRKQPSLRGLPTAVIQYNSYKGGALIAVSYEARKYGVKRSMRGDEAQEVCPQIQLVQVPVARGKADLNTYRNAGSEVVSVLASKGRCERASIDEVYMDLTEAAEAMLKESSPENLDDIHEEVLKSHVLGLHVEDERDAKREVRKWLCRSDADYHDKLLACGAIIVAELRMQVLKETEFTCSAGIAHNKMLAKLASAMNKPAQQTIVPRSSVKGLLESFPIKKMKQLGGKLGSSLQSDLGVNTVGELLKFSEEKLQQRYGINTGTWLWNIARGINGEEVEGRLLPKSHGSGKTFPGPQALKTISSVQHWLNQLCEELSERLQSDLDQNKRIARTLTLHARTYKGDSDSHKNFPSKSCPLRYGAAKIQEDAINLFQAGLREYIGFHNNKSQGSQNSSWGITSLSVGASKMVNIPSLQDSSCDLSRQGDGLTEESPLSSSQAFHSWNENGTTEREAQPEPKRIHAIPTLKAVVKKNTAKEKGNCSILELFKNYSDQCTSSEKQHATNAQTGKTSSIGSESNYNSDSTCNQVESLKEIYCEAIGTNNRGSSSTQAVEGRPSWSYRMEEIDPSVVDELPPEIQQEFRAWLRPLKRPNVVKRGSIITHYFSGNKN
ncbi:DNA polymerase eta isoform X6 [Neltuma alba]|uniref:DNA polymerase eta isoform X6 n=1 Tax=Neltuma alba TaxID=207710 RepID=UPI0010A49D2D|nr:DNA polymerase eta isoform X6 [Prosopis alba]